MIERSENARTNTGPTLKDPKMREIASSNKKAVSPRERANPTEKLILGLGSSLRATNPRRIPIAPRKIRLRAISPGIGTIAIGQRRFVGDGTPKVHGGPAANLRIVETAPLRNATGSTRNSPPPRTAKKEEKP